MYDFTIAIRAFYPSGFFGYLQPNTRMAKRPSTAITGDAKLIYHSGSVSYTHLTLPTILLV